MSDNMENTETEAVETQETTEQPTEKMFTQSDVDRLIEQRLGRERKKYEKQLDGIDLNEAKQLLQQKEADELEREIENLPDLVLVDELTCEDLPFRVVRRELNKEFKFCSTRTLTEYLSTLNQD